jgi:transposase
MDYFAGLDVSVKETSVCILDDTGKIVRETRVASEPAALLHVLTNTIYRFKRVGLEAGPLSQWLYSVLAEAGLPVICVETRHMRAVLKAQINKTDRKDARGIAQMMRVGLYRPVHVKTLRSQKLRMLLNHRKLLQSKAIAIENDLRATLRNFGLKVGMVGTVKFEPRIKELVENLPDLAVLVEPLLIVRRVLREQVGVLHRRLLAIVRNDDVCRRLMTVPGVGPVVALTYRVTAVCRHASGTPRRSEWCLADAGQASIGREQPNRRDITVWRRDDAGDALRSGPERAGAFSKMVLAQGLGDEDRQASRDEKGDRGASASTGGGSCTAYGLTAPNSGGPGKSQRHESCAGSNAIGGNSSSTERWNDVPRGTMDEVRSYVCLDLPLI